MSTTHAPADILLQAMLDDGIVVLPSVDSDWQGFVNVLPDTDDYRHNAVAVRDTFNVPDGRLMATGEVIEHPGIQIRVRGKTFNTGRAKAAAIANALDAYYLKTVTIDAVNYQIQNFSRKGNILSLGNAEQDRHRRDHFTINGTLTINSV